MNSYKTLSYALQTMALVATLVLGASAASKSDVAIKSSIRKSFVFKHYLKDDDIKVESKNGAVTLTGSVSAAHHKILANDTASDQNGVKSVQNKIEIKTTEPAEHSDAWLASKVKTTLFFHRSVSAAKTGVDAKDGIITLTGTVENQAQKDLSAQYARDIEGVKEVRNELTVSAKSGKAHKLEDRIDDSSITAQVKLALLFHRSTSAVKTHVVTRKGVVTLSGSAKNAAEKDLVEKIVSDVKGVKSVTNQINVYKS